MPLWAVGLKDKGGGNKRLGLRVGSKRGLGGLWFGEGDLAATRKVWLPCLRCDCYFGYLSGLPVRATCQVYLSGT